MTHISGFERSQILLLPEAVDDYVGADNPVRFIDAFVDGLGQICDRCSRRRLALVAHMKCAVCKYKFQPTRADAKTCSPACRQMRHWRRLGVTARNIERRFKRNVQACGSMGVHFSSKTVEWATPQAYDNARADNLAC